MFDRKHPIQLEYKQLNQILRDAKVIREFEEVTYLSEYFKHGTLDGVSITTQARPSAKRYLLGERG